LFTLPVLGYVYSRFWIGGVQTANDHAVAKNFIAAPSPILGLAVACIANFPCMMKPPSSHYAATKVKNCIARPRIRTNSDHSITSMKRLLTLLACTVASLHAQDPAPPPAAAKMDGRVAFSLKAPNAKEVSLRGQWKKEPLPLTKSENGDWTLTIDAVPAGCGNTALAWMG
jgi:hypothetical protein